MPRIRIKLVKSGIGRPQDQKDTLLALKLTKLNRVNEFDLTPQLLGMVKKVSHLIHIEEV